MQLGLRPPRGSIAILGEVSSALVNGRPNTGAYSRIAATIGRFPLAPLALTGGPELRGLRPRISLRMTYLPLEFTLGGGT